MLYKCGVVSARSVCVYQKKREEYQQEQRRREQEEIDKKKQIQREKVRRVWRM